MATSGLPNAFGGDIGEQRFSEMFDQHKRHIAYVGAALLVLGAGAWFYVRSNALKQQHAEQAYEAALQSVSSGNIPLAEADLRRVVVRYPGTNGGAQSAMALAKLDYEQGKYEQGIEALKEAASTGGDLQYGAKLLLATGYQGLGNPSQAAQVYQEAAGVARFDGDKAAASAMAARAFEQANNKAAAVKIWTELLKNPKSGFEAEADIRLGELQAQPMKV